MTDEQDTTDPKELTKEQIAEIKAANPGAELEMYVTPLGVVVIKCPSDPAWRSFSARVLDDNSDRNVTMIEFVTEHVVFPPAAEFLAMRKRKPAMMQGLSIKLQQLAGSKLIGEGKKL
jgi:hypothetical protein